MPLTGYSITHAPGVTERDLPTIKQLHLLLAGCTDGTKIHAREIEEKLGISETKLRAICNALRCNAVPVCSSSQGYWMAISADDLHETIQHLEQRIRSMSEAVYGLKKGMADLRAKKQTLRTGQIELI